MEQKDEHGMTHFIEHLLFKGTENRSAKDIAEALDSVGGQLNAFTAKEMTCYYARVMEEHLPLAADVLTDMTPLNYGIGQMAGILPQWLTSSPPGALAGMLRDPATRARLRGDCDRYWRFIAGGEWDRVRVQNCLALPELNGMSFPYISAMWNKEPWDCYFDILAAAAPNIGQVVLVSYLFTDEHLKETISNPLYMLVVDGYSTSVDGEAAKYTCFPLHYIGMAWFLTHHVREMGILSFEEAVRKMTSMPAGHFRLGLRGLIAQGYVADICAFDPERLETPFDVTNPAQYTRGMDYVFVRGVPVIDGGEHTGAKPGRNLRRYDMR
jgi:N-acyl-D-amino-acid deacylase